MSKIGKVSSGTVIFASIVIIACTYKLMTDRDQWRADSGQTHKDLTTMTADRDKCSKDAKDTHAKLDETVATLTTTKTELDTTKQTLASETDRANKLDTDLKDMTAKNNELTGKLQTATDEAAAAKKTVEELTAKVTDLNAQVATLNSAKTTLEDKVKTLTAEVNNFKGNPVPLPEGLAGKVLAVDKTWNFVVVDVGHKSGGLVGGKLIVSHGDKSIGKIKIVQLLEDKAIADILIQNDPKVAIEAGDGVMAER